MFKKLIVPLLLVMIFNMSGCSKTSPAEKEQLSKAAEPIVENMLQGIKEENYAKFSQDFNGTMKSSMPEAAFKELTAALKQKIGTYNSKNLWKTQKDNNFTVFIYKAKFDKESGDVITTVSIDFTGSKPVVGGLYFNSPNLLKDK